MTEALLAWFFFLFSFEQYESKRATPHDDDDDDERRQCSPAFQGH